MPYEQSLESSAQDPTLEISRSVEAGSHSGPSDQRTGSGSTETKRKYRRHPKADENAPERPPSAYVIFSNKIREEVKGQNLSFTDIAKLVGERWQELTPAAKEPFEAQAAQVKEKYTSELAQYKKTDAFREYSQYLANFKVKHSGSSADGKRAKLEKEYSQGNMSLRNVEMTDPTVTTPILGRTGSFSSASSLPSQSVTHGILSGSPGPTFFSTGISAGPKYSFPRGGAASPSNPVLSTENRYIALQSRQSSTSDDFSMLRHESGDPLTATSQLSLASGPSTPSMPSPSVAGPFARAPHGTRRPAAGSLAHQESFVSTASSGSARSSGSGIPMMLPQVDIWRGPEAAAGNPHVEAASAFHSGPGYSQMTRPTLLIPPIAVADRLPDVTQTPHQRTLPPLQSTVLQDPAYRMRNLPQVLSTSARAEMPPFAYLKQQKDPSKLETSENEAISTLAGLAYGSQAAPGSGSAAQDKNRGSR